MALDAARKIVDEEGLRALTTRKLATAIGYTGGTLYQLFENVDDLVEQMNAETIDELRSRCERIDFGHGPSQSLRALADAYIKFISEHPKIWNAIFERRRPTEEKYYTSVRRMLSVVERAIAPLFEPDEQQARLRDVQVLWAWIYGIGALASSNRLSEDQDVGRMIDTVIDIYVSSKLHTHSADPTRTDDA